MEKELDQALAKAKRLPFDIIADKYVIMSDHHIGDGMRGSDDFRNNKDVYKLALQHYFDNGCRFISIGDSEELWECDFPDIIREYSDIYAIERKFLESGRLVRLHGNHDIFWQKENFLTRYLQTALPGITICEAVLLESDQGRIFLTHGHQGEFFSDRLWRVGRFIVRNLWKPIQRALKIPSTGPAENVKKRDEKEKAYYAWARKNKVLFVAGHTHRAMFGSQSKIDKLRAGVEHLVRHASTLSPESEEYRENIKKISEAKEALRTTIAWEFGSEAATVLDAKGAVSPCYFNDGCCSYTNGLTALEIDSGRIRLVKWDRVGGTRTVYEDDSLRELFIRIELL